MNSNPLICQGERPDFAALRPEHVAPALEYALDHYREWLTGLSNSTPNWGDVVDGEQRVSDLLDRIWSPVAHLHAVSAEPGWRDAYADNVVKLSAFATELNQSRDRYEAYRSLRDDGDFVASSPAQQRVVELALRELELAGVNLEPDARQRYRDIVNRLTELTTRFEQNLKDATDAWSMTFASRDQLAGLPESAISQARERARAVNESGYRFGLDFPSYHALVTYADDREVRRQAYDAYVTRASDQGPHATQWDNAPLIDEILALRNEQARLLDFASYAELSLARKMVRKPGVVIDFLENLAARARPRAQADLDELEAFAKRRLEPWDIAYYSEKMRLDRHAVSDEEVRPYFPADQAVGGLFRVAERVFGIRFREREDVSVWDSHVRYFDVLDAGGAVMAGFYTDLYARRGKRGGAWMADCRARNYLGDQAQDPVALLNCNFPQPGEEQPSLLNHQEVTTLFHEFGHTLHHMLTRIDYPSVAGISGVEWDAVEVPSQFFENYCWEYEALQSFTRHYETGKPLPRDLFDRMNAARRFQSGLFLVRQLEFALADFYMHARPDAPTAGWAFEVHERVRERIAVITPPSYNRFLCGFSHIFAGGYAAGYYSYLWAEQLSLDAFDRFRDEGVFNPQIGAQFRAEILEVGGSRPAATSFVAFRGRDPRIEPLLAHYGLAAA